MNVTCQTKRRTRCRLCESSNVTLALPIAPTPVADAYIAQALRTAPQPSFPLDLYLCTDCGHAQLMDVVDPELLFGNYIYSTSNSLGLVEHFRAYAVNVVERFRPYAGSLAVDIGSNDGTLLRFLKAHGLRVLGVDPAKNIASQATASGIPTRAAFFDRSVANSIRAELGAAQLVTANNVFAHADNLFEIACGIADLLSPDGVFVFEVSYIGDIIERFLFDTIYHEHLCYHALAPLIRFLQRCGLELFDVERIANKGGSIRGYAQLSSAGQVVTERLRGMLQEEKRQGWTQLDRFRRYAGDIDRAKAELVGILRTLKAEGRVIAGFGASATVTTLLHHLEVGPWLDFLVDDNPSRHGLFSPGYHLPVRPPSDLLERRVDVVVIAAWQYAEPIMKKHAEFLRSGGQFLIPLPSPRLICQ